MEGRNWYCCLVDSWERRLSFDSDSVVAVVRNLRWRSDRFHLAEELSGSLETSYITAVKNCCFSCPVFVRRNHLWSMMRICTVRSELSVVEIGNQSMEKAKKVSGWNMMSDVRISPNTLAAPSYFGSQGPVLQPHSVEKMPILEDYWVAYDGLSQIEHSPRDETEATRSAGPEPWMRTLFRGQCRT